VEGKKLWSVFPLLATFALGIAATVITLTITRCYEKRDVARVLLPEVQSNRSRAEVFARVNERLLSGQQLKDERGNPLPDFSQAELLPGSFGFAAFDATLGRQGYFDPDLLEALHAFYGLLRQAEQFREAAASPNASRCPDLRAGLLKNVFESGAAAAKVAEEKNIARRLEEIAR